MGCKSSKIDEVRVIRKDMTTINTTVPDITPTPKATIEMKIEEFNEKFVNLKKEVEKIKVENNINTKIIQES